MASMKTGSSRSGRALVLLGMILAGAAGVGPYRVAAAREAPLP
jgi:hypothetical protein